MKFKAVIFDIDGTAVENKQNAKPSKRLIETIAKAKEKVFVAAATGRLLTTANWVIKPLKLVSPCIVSAGAQIVDPTNDKIIWEKLIDKKDVEEIFKIASDYTFESAAASQYTTYPKTEKRTLQDESIIYIFEVPASQSGELIKKLGSIRNIIIHEVPGYENGKVTLDITHKDATKKHALEKLTELLKLKKEEIIAVGDSKNDLPLFEAAGFKVAVANASDEFKIYADYVAPAAADDGLACAIEKFVLNDITDTNPLA